MTNNILYSFRRCPYAMRARFALIMAGKAYEHREILLKDKPQQMLEVSPKGTVPVMVLADETVLDESVDIMHWALADTGLSALSEVDRSLIQYNDTVFKKNLDLYKYASRAESPEETEALAYQDCMRFVAQLNGILKNQIYLSGGSVGFADIAIFPFIRQFARVNDARWQVNGFVYVQEWLKYLCSSTIFEKLMEKKPVWQGEID